MRKTAICFLLILLTLLLLTVCAHAGDASVSGQAWYDASGDGIHKEGARALARVSITLYRVEADGSETRLGQQGTRVDGTYAFTGLDAGTYVLSVTLPTEHEFIAPKEGGSVILPATGQISRSLPFVLEDGQHLDNMHIGASKASCFIKVYVFEDANQNGGRSSAEATLRYVPVSLYYEINGEWLEVLVEKTDIEGCATFWRLTPGTYRVAVTLPKGYIIGPMGEKINGWYNCFPPQDGAFSMTEPIDVARGESLGLGVGAVSSGSVAGTVWADNDCNGLRSAQEGGFAGAEISLVSEAAGVSRQTITDETGTYLFEGLLAGEYTLTVSLPENSMFSLPGGDSLLTEDYAFTSSTQITVDDKQEKKLQPIGVMPVTRLLVHFYNDLNANGLWDADEPPFAGADVEILSGDAVMTSARSDGSGAALIPVLRGGETEIRIILPAGQSLTVLGAQSDFNAPAATGDLTQPETLSHGVETQMYAGITLAAHVSGTLFNDMNVSGVFDTGEQGAAGFTVQAIDASGAVVAQTQTDSNGFYVFDNLLPQQHVIRFLLPNAYVCSEPSEIDAAGQNHVVAQNSEYGETGTLDLTPGQRVEHIDAAIFRSATVSGAVMLETGIQSLPVSGGIAGISVVLLDEYGAPVSDTTSTVTGEDGTFYLKGALPGEYTLEYTLPENAQFINPDTGAESYTTEPFTLKVGDDRIEQPLAAVFTGSLSGILYTDKNLSAAFDVSEEVLSDVTVTLTHTELDLEYETRSLDNGEYIFSALRPGEYIVRITLPEGLVFGFDPASPLDPAARQSTEGRLFVDVDQQHTGRNIAAVYPLQATEGLIYFDLTNDGVRDAGDYGAQDITLTLRSVNGPQSYTLMTNSDGVFTMDAVVPGEYTMLVTLSSDYTVADSNDARLIDGFWTSSLLLTSDLMAGPEYPILHYASVAGHVWSMDGSLTGVSGRTVSLFFGNEEEPSAQTETDAEGAFEFIHLKPGEYRVTCDLPQGKYDYARPEDAGLRPASLPQDTPDFPVGWRGTFHVDMAAQLIACDIGIGALGSLGDAAWLDENGNGLQDGSEPGIPGIHIALYQYGNLAAETDTDVFGRYLVTDLYPGTYTVVVTVPEELNTTVHREDFPLAASVLPQSEERSVEADGITVPSDGRNLSCDFGFVLRKAGRYPASMQETPETDWSFGGKRR